jgi:hypothetical protein
MELASPNGPTAGTTITTTDDHEGAKESFFVVNVVVVVTFRPRSKLRRTAGALAQAVVEAVGAFMLDSTEFRAQ